MVEKLAEASASDGNKRRGELVVHGRICDGHVPAARIRDLAFARPFACPKLVVSAAGRLT
jgi:hypothetical protein